MGPNMRFICYCIFIPYSTMSSEIFWGVCVCLIWTGKGILNLHSIPLNQYNPMIIISYNLIRIAWNILPIESRDKKYHSYGGILSESHKNFGISLESHQNPTSWDIKQRPCSRNFATSFRARRWRPQVPR